MIVLLKNWHQCACGNEILILFLFGNYVLLFLASVQITISNLMQLFTLFNEFLMQASEIWENILLTNSIFC